MMTVSLMLLGEGDVAHFWEWLKLKLYFAIGRSSTKSAKPVKLPVTSSTATLTKSQKTKTKKKPVEKELSKPASPVKNPNSSTSTPNSQVFTIDIFMCTSLITIILISLFYSLEMSHN